MIDKKIISELSLDGRVTCSFLANKLGISLSAASKRVRHLLKKKAIKIQAIINPSRVVYQENAFMLLRVDKSKINEIIRELHSVKEVIGIMTITNDYDLFLSLEEKDLEAIHELIYGKIMSLSGIYDMVTLVKSKIIKRDYGYTPINESILQNHSENDDDLPSIEIK